MATLPSLIKVSRSDPVRTADHDVESRKKSLRFGSIFMRRNSLDRDDAIHRSASKEARGLHSRTTTNSQFRKQNSFYDISSSKELDSSDDSGDIVPIDYDDEQEEEEDEPKTKHRNEDILDGVDNIQKLFKKQKRVKFSQLDLSGDDPVAPTPSNARTRRSPRHKQQIKSNEHKQGLVVPQKAVHLVDRNEGKGRQHHKRINKRE
eukprot:804184_1